MKGIYKGFKCTLSQIFVVKEEEEEEREMEIGQPTDVKHVAHIGWDDPSGTGTGTWMNELKMGQEFATTSMAHSVCSSQDFSGSIGQLSSESEMFKDLPSSELPPLIKPKKKWRKSKSTSSPTKSHSLSSSSSSSSRSSRFLAKSKSNFMKTCSRSSTLTGTQK